MKHSPTQLALISQNKILQKKIKDSFNIIIMVYRNKKKNIIIEKKKNRKKSKYICNTNS